MLLNGKNNFVVWCIETLEVSKAQFPGMARYNVMRMLHNKVKNGGPEGSPIPLNDNGIIF